MGAYVGVTGLKDGKGVMTRTGISMAQAFSRRMPRSKKLRPADSNCKRCLLSTHRMPAAPAAFNAAGVEKTKPRTATLPRRAP